MDRPLGAPSGRCGAEVFGIRLESGIGLGGALAVYFPAKCEKNLSR
jgi:hypothetical protein